MRTLGVLLAAATAVLSLSCVTAVWAGGSETYSSSRVTNAPRGATAPSYDGEGNLTFSMGGHGTEVLRLPGLATATLAEPPQGRALDAEYKNERDLERGVWAHWAATGGHRVDLVEKWHTVFDSATGTLETSVERKIVVRRESGNLELTTGVSPNATPSISPDGKWVVFCRDTEDRTAADIWRVDVGAGGLEPALRLTKSAGRSFLPAIAPDGRTVYFVSDRTGQPEIWLMGPDGSDQRRLTHGAAVGAGLAISPDGSKIAFSSTKGVTPLTAQSGNIWVMNAQGVAASKLTSDGKSQFPAFSRDGKVIAYQSYGGDKWDIFILRGPTGAYSDANRSPNPIQSARGIRLKVRGDSDRIRSLRQGWERS